MSAYVLRNDETEKYPELLVYPPILRNLLIGRGLVTLNLAQNFLNPDYEKHTHRSESLAGMEEATKRIIDAINRNEKIIIYSDYDADGIPGAVIFHDFFKKIGYKNFENYIPDRHTEGFGLNHEAIESFSKGGAKLLITIDCGIADVLEVDHANSFGLDVIITDHHLPGDDLPKACAIVNPKRTDCLYEEKMLCGAALVFKLVQALILKLSRDYALDSKNFTLPPLGWEKWLLDMVGLATLSDMVPLTGENRVLAKYGLMVLRKSRRVGLQKLLSEVNLSQRYLNEDDIGFMVSPRINAASRMGIPMDAFRLFATKDEAEAGVLAKHLQKINDERKGQVASIVKEAKAVIRERFSGNPKSIIVMGNPAWRPGLLGLVANNLMEEHSRPVFLWGREGGKELKGSCRSDGSVDLSELMKKSGHLFQAFGGHALSGGFTLLTEKAHLLEGELEVAYFLLKKNRQDEKTLVDAELSLEEVNQDLWNSIEKLSPFGIGNPKPLFKFSDVSPFSIRNFGKQGNHLELKFKTKDGKTISAIAFFKKPEDFSVPLKVGKKLNLLANMEKTMFRFKPEIRLRIVDII